MSKRFLLITALLTVSFGVTIYFALNYYRFWHKLQKDLLETIMLANKSVATEITNHLHDIEQLKNNINKSALSIDQAKQLLLSQPLLNGLILVPTQTTQAIELVKKDKNVDQIVPEISFDQKTDTWYGPSFSTNLQQWVISYWFHHDSSQKMIGLVLPLTFLKTMLNKSTIDATSYAAIIDNSGAIVAHQFDRSLPMKNTLFEQLNIEPDSFQAKSINEQLALKSQQALPLKDNSIGQDIWLATTPIEHTPWLVATIVYPHNFLQPSNDTIRQYIILVSISVLITLCLFFLMIGSIVESLTAWWIVIFVISCACMTELGFLWYVGFTRAREKHVNFKMVLDDTFPSNTKEHYVCPHGDFKTVQKCALTQATKHGNQEIVQAAKQLLEMINKKK